jgi:hypothetical protein
MDMQLPSLDKRFPSSADPEGVSRRVVSFGCLALFARGLSQESVVGAGPFHDKAATVETPAVGETALPQPQLSVRLPFGGPNCR